MVSHLRIRFDQELAELQEQVLVLGSCVREAVARGVQAEVTDLGVARGQDVLEEAGDERLVGQRDGAAVLGGEADAVLVDELDAMVGESDTVSVATEIADHLHGAAERRGYPAKGSGHWRR